MGAETVAEFAAGFQNVGRGGGLWCGYCRSYTPAVDIDGRCGYCALREFAGRANGNALATWIWTGRMT